MTYNKLPPGSSSVRRKRKPSGHFQIAVPLFVVGCTLNALSYFSVEPILMAIMVWGIGALAVRLLYSPLSYELHIYNLSFCACLFMGGVASLYRKILTGGERLDTHWFFHYSTGYRELDLEALSRITEGALAIIGWRPVYTLFSAIGFEPEIYIGILVNTLLVSISGVLAMRAARQIYGDDASRLDRLILLYSSCCILWLYAAFHLRDAFVLLTVSFLVLNWIAFLENGGIRSFLTVIISSAAISTFIQYLRVEFAFIPAIFLVVGMVSFVVFSRHRSSRRELLPFVVSGAGALMAAVYLPTLTADVANMVVEQNQNYADISRGAAKSGSLGLIIVDQPLPVRVVAGSLLLYIQPIPVWFGFTVDSAYTLNKSMYAIYNFFVMPLVFLAYVLLLTHNENRRPSLIFSATLVLGFTFALAATSMENRHMGSFMLPMLVLALLPDLKKRRVSKRYSKFVSIFLYGILFIHINWWALKVLAA